MEIKKHKDGNSCQSYFEDCIRFKTTNAKDAEMMLALIEHLRENVDHPDVWGHISVVDMVITNEDDHLGQDLYIEAAAGLYYEIKYFPQPKDGLWSYVGGYAYNVEQAAQMILEGLEKTKPQAA